MSTRARLGRSVGRVLRQPPPRQTRPPPRAGVLFLCISPFAEVPSCFRGTPACALGLTHVPLRGRLRFPTFLAHLQPPVPAVSTAHTQISPLRGEHKQHSRDRPAASLSPLPRTAAIFAHGHPSAHVRPCRGHLPRLPRTPRDMGTRAHPSPSRAALAQEASDRHWISVPFVALSSRNLSSLACLDHCGPHPTQHTLSPRPCGSWVPGSH